MKKVLIGCGVLVVIGGLMMLGAAWYGVHKVATYASSAQKTAEQMKDQQSALDALDKKYPFDAPTKGQPMKLDEARLQTYLTIREAELEVFKKYEAQAKDIQAKYGDANGIAGIEKAGDAMGMVRDLMTNIRETYATQLEKAHMGPSEFGSITGTIFASAYGATMAAQRGNLKDQLGKIDEQIKTATNPQIAAALQQQKAAIESLQTQMPSADSEAIFVANTKLTDKYKDRIQTTVNPGFDAFIGSDAYSKALGGAFGAK